MYYLINNDSQLSLAQQIAICDTFSYLKTAKEVAEFRKAKTGENWEVIEIRNVYTTQTLEEAMAEASDIPNMAHN